jgi:peroxiredoxin
MEYSAPTRRTDMIERMMSEHDPMTLPPDLPVPTDDHACDHLPGTRVPPVALPSTRGRSVVLANLVGRTVVYCYPRSGRPGMPPPDGWDAIPGARGCTPESCGFRDHYAELKAAGVELFGLSTQTSEYQKELVDRLHLPFEILSDADFEFANALRLPTFEVRGMTLIKRLTLVLRDGVIEKVFYPVFPPDRHADEVLAWLRQS